MFNGLGSVELTIDGLNASYQRLGTDGDLAVVLDLQQRIMTAIANHTPSVKALTESVSGTMVFEVLGGTADRAQYFGGVGFPGRSPMHQDVGFKSRVLHPNVDAIASIEVSPVWTNDHEIFVAFEVDTIRLDSLSFIERGRTAIELIQIALASFDLGGVN